MSKETVSELQGRQASEQELYMYECVIEGLHRSIMAGHRFTGYDTEVIGNMATLRMHDQPHRSLQISREAATGVWSIITRYRFEEGGDTSDGTDTWVTELRPIAQLAGLSIVERCVEVPRMARHPGRVLASATKALPSWSAVQCWTGTREARELLALGTHMQAS
ncbi:MAG TPA: hypothetical protein VFH39_05135 [Candidatus Saccharimonadales bacterium]|nr:hypothetical protein [Candidatus Saccharimonadales bacterium]